MRRLFTAFALVLLPGAAAAEFIGATCNFTRVCNNPMACQEIIYAMTVTQLADGAWVFRDDQGERPAVRLPEKPGKGIPAFASHAAFDGTAFLTLYSGGPALLVHHFEGPGFVYLNGSCELIQ
jgi:hypothetical protein